MAVSKRTRYEVLRRDNHACRYCGGTAPDVALTVDHVTPVSLGGSDDPSNLVAACKDCNAGKSSSSPDATVVADVAQDALRWSAAMRKALGELGSDHKKLRTYRKRFTAVWNEWDDYRGDPFPRPDTWQGTLDRWAQMGVPINVIESAVYKAMVNKSVVRSDKFRYFCGIVWRAVDDVRKTVEAELSPTAVACRHCWACRDGQACVRTHELEPDEEPDLCRVCGQRDCIYQTGWCDGEAYAAQEGFDRGYRKFINAYGDLIFADHILIGHIDNRTSERIEAQRWAP